MDAKLDTVIQDLQGAIDLGDHAQALSDSAETWRTHPMYVGKAGERRDPTAAGASIAVEPGSAGPQGPAQRLVP